MSAGPATKMYDYVKRWADRGFVEARERIEDLPPATLEAMDAAAEAMSGPAPETNYEEALDGSLILHADAAWGGPAVRVALSREEEDVLCRVLLERRIQRRKEGGA